MCFKLDQYVKALADTILSTKHWFQRNRRRISNDSVSTHIKKISVFKQKRIRGWTKTLRKGFVWTGKIKFRFQMKTVRCGRGLILGGTSQVIHNPLILRLRHCVIRTVSSSGEALYCNFCYSNKSWDECDSSSKKLYCGDDIPYVCYKKHRVEMKNDTEVHHYQKGCGPQQFCTGQECTDHGHWCKVNCCNTDACNASGIFYANYMTCITLAMLTAAHLLWIWYLK